MSRLNAIGRTHAAASSNLKTRPTFAPKASLPGVSRQTVSCYRLSQAARETARPARANSPSRKLAPLGLLALVLARQQVRERADVDLSALVEVFDGEELVRKVRHLHLARENRPEGNGIPHRARKRRSAHRERLAFHIAGDIAIGLLEQNDDPVVPLEVD